MVRVRAPGASWLVRVAHAPHSKRPPGKRPGWWQRVTGLVEGLRQPPDSLIACLDSNAKVGKSQSVCVGAEPPNANTELFEESGEAVGLALTLSRHHGPTTTWTSAAGYRSRLDFDAVPVSLLGGSGILC